MYIDPEIVEKELIAIDDIVLELEGLVNQTESNISSGWNSANAIEVSNKIEKCKEYISKIKTSITAVRQHAGETAAKIAGIDEAK